MPMAGAKSNVTTDHAAIQAWAEARGGRPARVRGTRLGSDPGMIRLTFPGYPGSEDEKLEPVSWDDFFDEFDRHHLALIYQETTAGGAKSNFNKLVSRETASAASKRSSHSASARRPAAGARKTAAKSTRKTARKAAEAKKSSARHPGATHKTAHKTARKRRG